MMTMYSSRKFNDDPRPYVLRTSLGTEYRSRFVLDGDHPDFLPRSEFDRPQHNPTNQILWSFFPPGHRVGRLVRPFVLSALREVLLGHWDGRVDVEMIDHARRVLTRLAALR